MRAYQRITIVAVLLVVAGCLMADFGNRSLKPPENLPGRDYVLEVTGYCPCQECCSWHRNWLFIPVTEAGHYKKVGYTASNTKAKPGTIAADTTIFPFGTIMYVPGYGYGRVEDRGGMIKGYHIDLFYDSHDDAKSWGHVRKYVRVWRPQDLRK